jgi:hypothetical protein
MYKYKLSIMVQYGVAPYAISSGPLRTARTIARAADRSDRSDHFGRLLGYSTVHSDSTYKAHGTQRATCGEYVLEGV